MKVRADDAGRCARYILHLESHIPNQTERLRLAYEVGHQDGREGNACHWEGEPDWVSKFTQSNKETLYDVLLGFAKEYKEAITKRFIEDIEDLQDQDRLDIFNKINEAYCQHCGIKLDGGTCHCWNDE